ncbi:hypothetical protein C8J57DRAFT_763538 [Mycena rebaudengoi]|nr:hypothetical protein C8J57DRAFT_763538 [Mycena rebaudengoi]
MRISRTIRSRKPIRPRSLLARGIAEAREHPRRGGYGTGLRPCDAVCVCRANGRRRQGFPSRPQLAGFCAYSHPRAMTNRRVLRLSFLLFLFFCCFLCLKESSVLPQLRLGRCGLPSWRIALASLSSFWFLLSASVSAASCVVHPRWIEDLLMMRLGRRVESADSCDSRRRRRRRDGD